MSLVSFALRACSLGLGVDLLSCPSRRSLQLPVQLGPLHVELLLELPLVELPSLIGNPPSCSGARYAMPAATKAAIGVNTPTTESESERRNTRDGADASGR
jgi:hypothetical protein